MKSVRLGWRALLLSLAVCGAANAAPETESKAAVLLRRAQVWTADEGKPHAGWSVLIEGERIASVGPDDRCRTDEPSFAPPTSGARPR